MSTTSGRKAILGRVAVCAGIAAVLVVWAACWPYTGDGDAAMHQMNLLESARNARHALTPWARPGFVALMILPALGGTLAVRGFAAVLAAILSWQTMRLADDLKLPNATLAGLLVIWQPLYFALAADTMTEMPMALGVVLAVRLWKAKRAATSCLLISFLPLVRPEGFFLAVLWGAMTLFGRSVGPFWRRRVWICMSLAAGMLCWIAACWIVTASPLYFIQSWSWPVKSYAMYGRGYLLHHVALWPYYCGPVLIVLFVAGVVPSARRGMGLPWAVWGIVFGVHSILWWLGMFGELGLMRIQACSASVTAVVCLYGWNAVGRWAIRRNVSGRTRRVAAGLAVTLATGSVFLYYVLTPSRYLCFPIREAARYVRQSGQLKDAPRVFAPDYIAWMEMDVLLMSPRAMKSSFRRGEQLQRMRALPVGSIGMWDNYRGKTWHHVAIEELDELGFEVLHESRQPLPRLPWGLTQRIPPWESELRCVVLRKRR